MSFLHNGRRGGKHRKVEVSASSRVAIAALSASTIASSAAVASAQTTEAKPAEAKPAQQAAKVVSPVGAKTEVRASQPKPNKPLVLASPGFTPSSNLVTQLATALQYNQQRIASDLLARAPQLVKPTTGTLTSPFGPRWGTFHYGVDIANATNTPIYSIMDGTVISAGPAQGYGQWVRVLHNDGSVSVYGHVESLYVAVGEIVRAGQTIAGMGNRGFSTGTHLHFEIHPDGTTPVDPVAWFQQNGVSFN